LTSALPSPISRSSAMEGSYASVQQLRPQLSKGISASGGNSLNRKMQRIRMLENLGGSRVLRATGTEECACLFRFCSYMKCVGKPSQFFERWLAKPLAHLRCQHSGRGETGTGRQRMVKSIRCCKRLRTSERSPYTHRSSERRILSARRAIMSDCRKQARRNVCGPD